MGRRSVRQFTVGCPAAFRFALNAARRVVRMLFHFGITPAA